MNSEINCAGIPAPFHCFKFMASNHSTCFPFSMTWDVMTVKIIWCVYSRDNKNRMAFLSLGLVAQSQQTQTHTHSLHTAHPKTFASTLYLKKIFFTGNYVFALPKFTSRLDSRTGHIVNIPQRQQNTAGNDWCRTKRFLSETGSCFACKDLVIWKGREECLSLVKAVKCLQCGPSFEIYEPIRKKLRVTILVFTIAPGGKEPRAVFGTTGQTGYLLLFLFVSKKEKKKEGQHYAGRSDIYSVRGSHSLPTLKPGCGMFSLPSFS